MSENSLISDLRNGDQKTLEKIYSDYRTGFLAFLTTTHNCSTEVAIDIYQYVILSFYENVVDGNFEEMSEAGLKTYLFSIGKNKLLGDLRKRSKLSLLEAYSDDALIEEGSLETTINERYDEVSDVISNLGNPCKRILELFYFNKLSTDEIAKIMGYNNGNTVKNLKYKCIQRIKKIVS
ncbi:MAG: RNA polymerase sigma factor (sigma-70 family) [Roseivirga sp.]|jgi:RNA polymerase sigma factor (sigma-70 family)